MGRSSSPVGYGIGIAEVVGSNPTRSTVKYMVFIHEWITIIVGIRTGQKNKLLIQIV